MSIEIHLQRFDPTGEELPVRPGVLRDLERVAREVLKSAADADVAFEPDHRSFTVDLPGGTATVHETYAHFPVQELDPLSLRVIFEIARTGDMAIVIEGGSIRVILTDPAQRAGLPSGWVSDDAVALCRSPEHLEHLLMDWYAVQAGYTARAFPEAQQPAAGATGTGRTWAPGSRPEPPASFVYLEAKPKETATKQENRVSKHYKNIYKAGGPHRPENGVMMPEFWPLVTPAGRMFYAYGYGGDKENWLGMFRDFAASEGRALGWIENFDTFVQDDGQRFPLGACTSAKASD